MSFDLAEIISKMSIFALSVVVVLGFMAVATLSVCAERLWVYWRQGKRAAEFGPVAAKRLTKNDHEGLLKDAKECKPNYLAAMLEAGSATYIKAVEKPSRDLSAVEITKRELVRKADVQASKLRRGLSVLASVGSTAPFVGLLGTVIGIIASFQGIAAEGSGGLGAVSAGVAEALVVTAFGLMVAIPAVLVYNFLTTKSDSILQSLDQFRGEFLDHLEASHSDFVDSRDGAGTPYRGAERADAA